MKIESSTEGQSAAPLKNRQGVGDRFG